MSGVFTFQSDTFNDIAMFRLAPTLLSPGNAGGTVNNPGHPNAVTPSFGGQAIDSNNEVDIFAIAITAGQTYRFDIDQGAGDASDVDTEIELVDYAGNQVAQNDDGGVLDSGSASDLDPLLNFTATRSGIYFLSVAHFNNDYLDGEFGFDNLGSDTGDYRLVVSTPTLPTLTTLSSGANSQTFNGSAQRVNAAGGNDSLNMGGGADMADGGAGNDTVNGVAGHDQLFGSGGADRLNGGVSNDVLFGDAGNDFLEGGDNLDEVSGGNGGDRVFGGAGHDRLWGDDGDDTIVGGAGNDFIRGGTGIDDMAGGGGADTFHFLFNPNEAVFNVFGGDAITDFSGDGLGGDLIDLSDVFDGTLTFRAFGPFQGTAGEVRVEDLRDPGTGFGFQHVRVDLNGDTNSDMGILVDYQGSFNVHAEDFVL